jgi:hypothetical protein
MARGTLGKPKAVFCDDWSLTASHLCATLLVSLVNSMANGIVRFTKPQKHQSGCMNRSIFHKASQILDPRRTELGLPVHNSSAGRTYDD